MNTQVPLALLGFSAFEASTIEAFIRTAEARRLRQAELQEPRFVFTNDVAAARIVLVDSASDTAMRDTRADPARCIYIGGHGRPGQLAHLTRPISLPNLLETLAIGAERALDTSSSIPHAARDTTGPASANSSLKRILVVDDSDVAPRFLASCLGHFGFEVRRARSGEEALSCVAAEPYAFVFMDINMPGIDAYQACKLIKKRPYPAGRSAPVVVMLTSRPGVMDKVRGSFSFCDAHLAKPLQLEAVIRVLGDAVVSDFAMQGADT
jgi:CheY-like chemotaxis protein